MLRDSFTLSELQDFLGLTDKELADKLSMSLDVFSKHKSNINPIGMLIPILAKVQLINNVTDLRLVTSSPVFLTLMWTYYGYRISIDPSKDAVVITFPKVFNRYVVDYRGESKLVTADHITIKGYFKFLTFSINLFSSYSAIAADEIRNAVMSMINPVVNNSMYN